MHIFKKIINIFPTLSIYSKTNLCTEENFKYSKNCSYVQEHILLFMELLIYLWTCACIHGVILFLMEESLYIYIYIHLYSMILGACIQECILQLRALECND